MLLFLLYMIRKNTTSAYRYLHRAVHIIDFNYFTEHLRLYFPSLYIY